MPFRLPDRLSDVARNRRGSIAPLLAIGLPLLIGCAGLAVDVMQWTLAKRELQRVTDSAAIAGVYSVLQSSDAESGVASAIATDRSADRQGSVEVQHPVPGREADGYAVAVQLTAPLRMSFSGLFLSHVPMISARAVATVVTTGEYCGLALASNEDTALLIRANSDVQGNCGLASNASGTEALRVEGGAEVSAHPLVAAGVIAAPDNLSVSRRSYGLPLEDPLADTEPPLVPATGCPNITVNPNSPTVALEPGCYGNLVLNGSTRLQEGEYILNRGSLIIGPNADVSCDACTIFLTSEDPEGQPGSIGTVRIHAAATVHLAAPTEGADSGIVIYQDRHALVDAGENAIAGNSFSKITGLIYTPSRPLRVNGGSGADVTCARFLGRTLILEGRIYVGTGCAGGDRVKLRGREVRLIG
jgi:hypothetical protein